MKKMRMRKECESPWQVISELPDLEMGVDYAIGGTNEFKIVRVYFLRIVEPICSCVQLVDIKL